ncbi:MAG: zinc ribbon domain-containing protein [Ruminococcus sp.]|nr:zinc ribbon domain-containing protein [Ruminococcus sp.]
MKKVCGYCGAVIDDGAKICTNCGKMIAGKGSAQKEGGLQFSNYGGSSMPVQNKPDVRTPYMSKANAKHARQEADNRAYQRAGQSAQQRRTDNGYDPVRQAQQQRVPFVTNSSSGKEKSKSKIMPLIGKLVKIILVLFILYALFGFIRVMLVRSADYDFKLGEGMKLECENYGEAMDNYFEKGKWRYHLKGNCVTYTGETKSGEEYELTFGKKNKQTAVTKLVIDGKAVDKDKIMDIYIMGMFM